MARSESLTAQEDKKTGKQREKQGSDLSCLFVPLSPFLS